MLEIFNKLEKNVCRVFLNEKGNGTGFLISNKFILTDYHVIDEASSIKVKFDDNENFYKVILSEADSKYKELDIALLELEREVDFYEHIEVEDRRLERDEKWVTIGYPATKNGRAEEMRNDKYLIHKHLSKIEEDEKFDIELNFDTSKWSSYGGLSGSPIVVNDCIVGIIKSEQIEDSRSKELYGLSAKYFIKLIDEVRKKEQEENKITDTLKNGKSIELIKVELDDSRTLYIGKYPVTFEEYDLFCEETNRCKKYEPNDCGWGRGKKPVINVSLNDAKDYCHWLTDKSGQFIKYILPSLEDWLSISKHNKQKEINFEKCAWYGSKETTINVDDKKIESDNLGIIHLYGNISEWCIDEFVVGGSFQSSCIDFLLENEKYEPIHTHETIGFRIIHKKF